MPPGTNSSLVEIKTRSHFFTSGGSSQYRKAQSSVLRNWFLVRLEIWQKWNFNLKKYILVAMMAMKEINNSTDILPGHRYFLQSMNVVQFWIMFMFLNVYEECFFVNYTWTQVFFPFFLQWVMFMWIYHTKQLDSSIKWNSWLNSNVTTVWLTFTFSWK